MDEPESVHIKFLTMEGSLVPLEYAQFSKSKILFPLFQSYYTNKEEYITIPGIGFEVLNMIIVWVGSHKFDDIRYSDCDGINKATYSAWDEWFFHFIGAQKAKFMQAALLLGIPAVIDVEKIASLPKLNIPRKTVKPAHGLTPPTYEKEDDI